MEKLRQFSADHNIPVCLEATLDVNGSKKQSFIQNLGNMLQSPKFVEQFDPDKIIFFGRNPVSKNLERYLNNCNTSLVVVNPKGENFGRTAINKSVIKMDENVFIESLPAQENNSSKIRIEFKQRIKKLDEIFQKSSIILLIKRISILRWKQWHYCHP
ncbi:MAG: hypothetical protein IPJ75_19110 [Ignavibacteriales bacterium]|nr:hypothetical protein [Ignavibacteriales bacterium]